ncbi:hypothetical protein [Maribacter forsetii]|uniref:hypothetical protein n=1 Tax=Maribacter forsetii TaxID=444515 RepID=UPI00056D4A11|nr:hypothetical protein [Maribacter forsetii]
MKYHYSKSKFSNQFFFKKIQSATLEHTSGVFQISVTPYFHYSGKYHIQSVAQKDNERTIYLTIKSQDMEVSFEDISPFNKYFVSISHDGKKAMVFTEDANGIILKS